MAISPRRRPTTLRTCLLTTLSSTVCLVAAHTIASAQSLIVQGSTTFNDRLMEPYQPTIEAMAGVTLQVIPNKSLNGLSALLEGRADLAMISSPLELELQALRATKPGPLLDRLIGHQIANTRIAFAVNPKNPIRKTDLAMIRRILLGEVSNWLELGGPDLPIRVAYVGKAGGVTHTVQTQVIQGKEIVAINAIPLASAEQVIKVVEQEPGAIGLAQVRLIATRNLPELETDQTISQVLTLVTLGEPTPPIMNVIEAARKIAGKRLALANH